MPDRILDFTSGVTMVISDLHGDKDAFARHIGRFLQLRSRHKVDRMLLLGDLIHRGSTAKPDDSLSMVLDVMRMQRKLPPGSVVMLLGNHEMPHLYGISLSRGKEEYTPSFEKALTQSGKRDEVLAFFDSLPFYVRTAAGVTFAHAGPVGNALPNMDTIRHFDHRAILEEFDHALSINPYPEQLRALYAKTMGMPYEVLARYYLAVSGPEYPRYDHLVRSTMISKESKEFELLWDLLFTRCEQQVPMALYSRLLKAFLEAMSVGAPAPQNYLVTGHMPVKGGYAIVTDHHMRIASAVHATPREAGQYLLLDFGRPIELMEDLLVSLGSVF